MSCIAIDCCSFGKPLNRYATTTMSYKTIYNTDTEIEKIFFIEAGSTWHFLFKNKIVVVTSGFWRLIQNKRLRVISTDEGHQFGLPLPINTGKETAKYLEGKNLFKIKINKFSGDLTLYFSDDLQIEIFISSMGYETFDLYIDDLRLLGMGGGEIVTHKR